MKNRLVRDDGINHTPVISFEDNIVSSGRLKTFSPVVEGSSEYTDSTRSITFTIDMRGFTYCTLGVKNTGNTNVVGDFLMSECFNILQLTTITRYFSTTKV